MSASQSDWFSDKVVTSSETIDLVSLRPAGELQVDADHRAGIHRADGRTVPLTRPNALRLRLSARTSGIQIRYKEEKKIIEVRSGPSDVVPAAITASPLSS